jgi:hypothetical protein
MKNPHILALASSFVGLVGLVGLAACGDNLTLPPERAPAESGDTQELDCIPDLNGTIERDELAAAIGVPINYLVSPPGVERPVDLAGSQDGEGKTIWNFSVDYADDQALVVTPTTPAGTWFEGLFDVEGAFVTPFDAGGAVLSVGVLADDGLYLLGVVSSEEEPKDGQTRLVYTDPVLILPLPVEVGASHVAVGEIIDGAAFGLPYAGRDVYEVSVDAIGAADLPQLSFDQVHRVVTKVTVEPVVGTSASRRQVSFYAECFAEIARASADGDEDELFGTATELRRLGF